MDHKHDRTTSGVTCHHRLWTAHKVERRRAWHAIIAFGQHTQLNDVGRGMTSLPLDSTHGRTTLGVTCHHRLWTAHTVERRRAFHYRLWAAHTVERRRAWQSIIAFRQHTRSNNGWQGTTSLPLDSTHGRTTSGVRCHHHLWTAHSVERRRVWHYIIAILQHTRSDDVWRCM